MEQYHKALAVRLENAKQNPDNVRYRRELSLLYSWMGHFTGSPLRMSLGDRAKAEEYYRRSLEIAEKLAAEDPNNAQGAMDLAFSHEYVANVVERDPREAVELYRKALAVLGPRLANSPGERSYRRREATELRLLAVVLRRSGGRTTARDQMREALAKVRSLVSAQPANDLLKGDMHASLVASANLRLDTGARGRRSANSRRQWRSASRCEGSAPRSRLGVATRRHLLALGHHHAAVAVDPRASRESRAAAIRESCDWRRKALAVWEAWPAHAVSSAFDATRREQAARAVAGCTPDSITDSMPR